VAHVSRSSYYRWLKQKDAIHTKNLEILQAIRYEHTRLHGILGYRRMTLVLHNKYKIVVSTKQVYRIMRENCLLAAIRRKRRPSQVPEKRRQIIVENRLYRNFLSPMPGKKYVTDITYIPISNSMAYISALIDLYNGEVVAYKISQSLDRSLSIDVVQALAAKRPVRGAMIHSDQGIHYTNRDYHQLLKDKNIIQSMSRKGNCWDNAMMENFFSHLKCECVRRVKRSFRSFLDVFEVVEEYIRFYNEERPQLRLQGLSPVSFRQQFAQF
jgi:putative transposase